MGIVKGFKEGVTERWQQHRIFFIVTGIVVLIFLVLLSGLIVQIDVQVTK